ncbi:MAG: HAD-IA family hydrolase [Pseudomonadota bacterium]
MSTVNVAANFDAAIIDLDGTLIDTMGDFVEALNRMLADMRWPDGFEVSRQVSRAVVEPLVGKGSENLIHSVLNHLVVQYLRVQPAGDGEVEGVIKSASFFDAAFESYQKHYNTINGQQAQVYPGVLQGLLGLHQAGLPMACLTNKPLAFAMDLLRIKGLDGFFGVVFGGDSFERKKPDPLPLLKTCEALGTRPARTLMIGDSSNDAQAARAAACPVVLVTYGYNHGEPVRRVDADGFVDSLLELLPQPV